VKKYKLRINHFAQNDIEMAKEYYDDKRTGLGDEFWQETKEKLKYIEKNPRQFRYIHDNARIAILKKFPFGIFFICNDLNIDVFGVIHFSRSPLVWKNRIETKG
jgi:hypothetical protein